MDSTHIDTFLFDIGNVLVTFDFTKVIRFLAEHSTAEPETIKDVIEEGITRLETGIVDGNAFLTEIATTLSYSGKLDRLQRAYQDIFEPVEAMHELVDLLCKDYRLVLFSNTSDLHKDWLFDHYSVFSKFDDAVFSFVSGHMKPSKGMYEDAQHKLGIDPRRTIYFDDAPANIATGKELGFHAIRYLPEIHSETLARLGEFEISFP